MITNTSYPIDIYRTTIKVKTNVSTIYFEVKPAYDIEITLPSEFLHESEIINLTLINKANYLIENIGVKVDLKSSHVLLHDKSMKHFDLLPNQNKTVSWNVSQITKFIPAILPITYNIYSVNGGSEIQHIYHKLIRPSKINMRIIYNESVLLGDKFGIKAIIQNTGDKQLSNVEVTLILPTSLSTTEPLTKDIGDLSGGESSTVNWTVKADELGSYGFDIIAEDETGNYNATNGGGVIVYEEGHSIDVLIDGMCKWFRKDCESSKGVLKDGFVTFTITIQNLGYRDDVVDVYVWKDYRNLNWTTEVHADGDNVLPPFSVFIPANTYHNLTLKLKPYPGEEIGKEGYVKIYARSQNDWRKEDRVIAHAVIVPESMFSVTPQKIDLTINHSSQESFNITISNKGSTIINNISLTPSGSIAPWTALSKTNIASLEPEGSQRPYP